MKNTLNEIDAELTEAEKLLCEATQRMGNAVVIAGRAGFVQIDTLLNDALEHKAYAEQVVDAARAIIDRDLHRLEGND